MSHRDDPHEHPTPALSASASSFRPADASHPNDYFPAGSSLWGAIGQSCSFVNPGAAASSSSSSSLGGKDAGSSSLPHSAGRGAPGPPESEQLSLWNFGNFDVDALASGERSNRQGQGYVSGQGNPNGNLNSNPASHPRQAPRPSSAGAADSRGLALDDGNVNLGFMGYDHRSAPSSDVIGLASAFGNVHLNQAPGNRYQGGNAGNHHSNSHNFGNHPANNNNNNNNYDGGGGTSRGRHPRDEGAFGPPAGSNYPLSNYPAPGWDSVPRWTPPGQAAPAGGMYASSAGAGRGSRPSNADVPPYPPPGGNDYGLRGGAGGYPMPPGPQGYGLPSGYGSHRQGPSFVPPPNPYGMGGAAGGLGRGLGLGHGHGRAEVPTGPYPPSFPTADGRHDPSSLYSAAEGTYGDDGGGLESTATGGALASLLQTPFNAAAHARQRKYPPILGGAPVGAGYEGYENNVASGNAAGNAMGYPTFQGMDSGGNGSGGAIIHGGNRSSGPPRSGGDRSNVSTATAPSSSGLAGEISPALSATDKPNAKSKSRARTNANSNPAPDANAHYQPILPKRTLLSEPTSPTPSSEDDARQPHGVSAPAPHDSQAKKREWLLSMNQALDDTPIGRLDPNVLPLSTIMNGWAKQKSSEGARMVEHWLDRVHNEYNSENPHGVHPTARMYTMAVDAWAKSGGGAPAARRAEALLERMDRLYRAGGGRHEALKPTTGIFNAVINAWARSREKVAPARAEQILAWMEKLREQGGEDLDISPDKYTFNTVIHAYAKSGAKEAATKAHRILENMIQMYREGNSSVKPDTITYNVVINAYAKSGTKGAAQQAENLLQSMHLMYDQGDLSVKPNVVTYGAVIDAFAKSMDRNAAGRADALLANMVQLHQSDPVRHADLRPNTYVFNTVINAWAKSKERGAAAKAEEMLVAMDRLHASGFPGLKPDAFTYTAVIDAYAKSGYRGAASRADLLLDQMEAKYAAGDVDLKPNTFTYNAVINALAKSGEHGAAARAERVLHNMVNRLRTNGGNDVKPTTINFNTVLDAWAKSGEGEAAAERAEAILEWMDRLNKAGNSDVKPDTITFNAVIDAWARSGCKRGPQRAEQILNHMDELYQGGNMDVKPDTYTYNTLINALAKSGDGGAASRAEEILVIMEARFQAGDKSFKPNTRSHTSVIDAWAKSGEQGAALRAEQILENLKALYERTGDPEIKPNVYTANAVMNACAFSKHEEDRDEALAMAFRTFEWLDSQKDIKPDAYTFTIMLSVCTNLIPKEESAVRFEHAKILFQKCCDSGHVNDHVLWKLKIAVNEMEYHKLVGYGVETKAADLPASWSRLVSNNKKSGGDNRNNNWSRRGKKHSM
mmetsp:Transcript_12078/g.24626  ORF Transcript_12078/g.24626 Transcript_12078/m.24626 type:complete len:1353 (+) Transcript_12078:875-4933(+)